jgi:hypothetical protein
MEAQAVAALPQARQFPLHPHLLALSFMVPLHSPHPPSQLSQHRHQKRQQLGSQQQQQQGLLKWREKDHHH